MIRPCARPYGEEKKKGLPILLPPTDTTDTVKGKANEPLSRPPVHPEPWLVICLQTPLACALLLS